jgi:hypothetical protein
MGWASGDGKPKRPVESYGQAPPAPTEAPEATPLRVEAPGRPGQSIGGLQQYSGRRRDPARDDRAALTVLDSIFSSNSPDNIFGPYTDGGGNTFH